MTSCDADSAAMQIATVAIAARSRRGSNKLIAAIAQTRPIWNTSTQPYRRPRNGRANRSSSGAHANLNVYASPTSDIAAIPRSETCSAVSQACSVWPVSNSASPDENPSRNSTAIRRERNTRNQLMPELPTPYRRPELAVWTNLRQGCLVKWVNIHEAKPQLSRLLKEVERGE